MPGFHDAHNHMAWFGIGLDDVPLGPEHCKHVDDVYDAIAKRAKAALDDVRVLGTVGLRSLREEHRALAWSFVLAEVLQRRAAALNSMKGPV